jgi:hypothetical protein
VYDRYKLFPNAKFKGPAIIEERESTLIVGEDATVSVDDYGFLWVDFTAQGKRPITPPQRRRARGTTGKRTVQGGKPRAKAKAKKSKPKARELKRKAKPAKKSQAVAKKVKAAKPKAVKAKGKVKRTKPQARKSKAVKSKR